jgi:hypothetical protein
MHRICQGFEHGPKEQETSALYSTAAGELCGSRVLGFIFARATVSSQKVANAKVPFVETLRQSVLVAPS